MPTKTLRKKRRNLRKVNHQNHILKAAAKDAPTMDTNYMLGKEAAVIITQEAANSMLTGLTVQAAINHY